LQKENQELRLSLRQQAEEVIKNNSIQITKQEVNRLKFENDQLKENLRRKEEEIIHFTSQQIEFQHHYAAEEGGDPSVTTSKKKGVKSNNDLLSNPKRENNQKSRSFKTNSPRPQNQRRSGTPLKSTIMPKNKDLHDGMLQRRVMELEQDVVKEQAVIKKLQNKHKREMAELVKNLEKEISSGRVLRSKNRELQREVTRLKSEVDSLKATKKSTSRSSFSYPSRNRTSGYTTPTNSSRNRSTTTTPRSVGSRGSNRSMTSNQSYGHVYGNNERSMYSSRDSIKSGSYTPKSVSSLGSRMSSGTGVSNRSKRSTTPSYTRSTASYRSQTNKASSSVKSRSPLPRGYTSPYSQKALNSTSSRVNSNRTPSQKGNIASSSYGRQGTATFTSSRNSTSVGDYDENGVYIRRANGSDQRSNNINSPYSVRSNENRTMSYLTTTSSSRRSRASSSNERVNTSRQNTKNSKKRNTEDIGTLRAKTTSLTIPPESSDRPRSCEAVSSSHSQIYYSRPNQDDNNSNDGYQREKSHPLKMPNSARNYGDKEFIDSNTTSDTNLSAMLRRPSPRKQTMESNGFHSIAPEAHGSDPVLDLNYQKTPQYAWEDKASANSFEVNRGSVNDENNNRSNISAKVHENKDATKRNGKVTCLTGDEPTIEITPVEGSSFNIVEKENDGVETIENNKNSIVQPGYDSGSEIGEIDRRLNALQAFLKQAKSGVIGKIPS